MLETITALLGTTSLAALGWAFRLSNRVAVVEANMGGLKDLINTRFDNVEGRLERIEKTLNGRT